MSYTPSPVQLPTIRRQLTTLELLREELRDHNPHQTLQLLTPAPETGAPDTWL